MYIKTKIAVKYSNGPTKNHQLEGIIYGQIIAFAYSDDCDKFHANYRYLDSDLNEIWKDGFPLEGALIDDTYELVKSEVPSGLKKRKTMNYETYLVFIHQMAQAFDILPSDIELIDDKIETAIQS